MSETKHLFEIAPDGNVLLISLKAPFVNDTEHLENLEDGLRDLLGGHDQRLLLLDLSEVECVVSRMINSLLLMVKRVRAEGGQVHLCGLEPKVERVFKTMKLDRVFDIYNDRTEGLVSMKHLETQLRTAQFA